MSKLALKVACSSEVRPKPVNIGQGSSFLSVEYAFSTFLQINNLRKYM